MTAVLDPAGPLGVALVYVVLGAGLVVTSLALVPQIRRLPQALADAGPPFVGLAATVSGVGVASITGGALAVSLGGAGALPWMWIAAFFGMGFTWLDTSLAARLRGHDRRGAVVATTMRAIESGLGDRAGALLGLLLAFALALTALGLGALLQAQQVAEIFGEVAHASSRVVGLGLALALAPLLVAFASPGLRGHVLRTAAWSVGIYCLISVGLVASDTAGAAALLEQAFAGAFDFGAAAAGATGGAAAALAHGVMRGATAGVTGLGALALQPEVARAADPERAGARAMVAPLISAVVATLSALVLLSHGTSPHAPLAERELVDLETHHSRGLLPSERGQTFVLPADTPLLDGHRYPMVLRANPRGHRFGQLFRDENLVAVPLLGITATTDTVLFRDRDPERAKNPGYDVAVPCERELVETRAGTFIKLRPRDPAVNFRSLMNARGLDGPFLLVDDLHFVGAVERALSGHPGVGEHLALYEEEIVSDDARNLSVREAIALGFRGPYYDDGEPPLPRALVSTPDFTPAIGDTIRLRFAAPDRGLALGFLNRVHELETPPWDFLAAADTAILRHRSDPSRDLRVPVQARLVGGRLRFASTDPAIDFRDLAATDYEGPFLLPPPLELEVEVHGDQRLPERFKGRRSLVPVEEPAAPGSSLARPSFGAILSTGMEGPVVAADGAGLVAVSWGRALGPATALVLAIAVLVSTLVAMAAWAERGATALAHLLGEGAAPAFRALFVVAVAVGAGLGIAGALEIADVAVLTATELHLLCLVFLPLVVGRRV